jgi:hypothetical protein
LWRRLEALEERRKMQDGPVLIRQLCFINPDRTEVEATVAKEWAGDFVSYRRPGEALDAFKSRASDECRATKPREPVFLFFMDQKEESSDAA